MSQFIIGFFVALGLAVLVIIWIAYCMFIRERHKSEHFHHNISDLERRNNILSQDCSSYSSKCEKEVPKKNEFTAAVFVLPSRNKQKENYEKRPDYPESSAPFSHSTNQLIDILDDTHYKDGIYEVDSCPPGDSEA